MSQTNRTVLLFVLASLASACSSKTFGRPADAVIASSGTAGVTNAAGSSGAPGAAGTSAGESGSAGGSSAAAGNPSGPSTGFGTYGQDTPGGKGGTVLKVTTLAASGPGSLLEALNTPGPRIIVFEVGGIIDLNRARLSVTQPFVTIAGQSAPSPGITLIRGGVQVATHDVVIQHLRFRMGDAGATAGSGFEPDVTTDGGNAYNVIFDHCSVAWGVDENLSVSGPRFAGPEATSRRVIIRSNIIAEGLYNSVHSKGVHSMGTLIHDYCTDVAVVGNFYAHNNERNPWFKAFGTGVIVNNLIYNPGRWAMRLGAVPTEWTTSGIVPGPPRVSIVGNFLRYGANTPAATPMVGSNSTGAAYIEDNVALDVAGNPAPISGAGITLLAQKPAWPDGLTALPASAVAKWVLAHAGARPKERDAVDERLIAGYRAGAGAFVNKQDEVGGYPTAVPTQRALSVPASDVDDWLAAMAAELE